MGQGLVLRLGAGAVACPMSRQSYLQQLREISTLATEAEDDPFVALLLEGAMLHLQADLQWLDLCDERLEQIDS